MNTKTIFGGGADTVSRQTGIRKKLVVEIQNAFKSTYFEMQDYQAAKFAEANEDLIRHLSGTATVSPGVFRTLHGMYTPNGALTVEYLTETVTGRRLSFHSYDTPPWQKRRGVCFSPTEFKNYEVQSISTGDIVPMVLGIVSCLVYNYFTREEVLVVNTVHDSIVFDCCNAQIAQEVCEIMGPIMADAPKYFEYFYGTPFDLDLPVTATFGPSWKDQSNFEKEFR